MEQDITRLNMNWSRKMIAKWYEEVAYFFIDDGRIEKVDELLERARKARLSTLTCSGCDSFNIEASDEEYFCYECGFRGSVELPY